METSLVFYLQVHQLSAFSTICQIRHLGYHGYLDLLVSNITAYGDAFNSKRYHFVYHSTPHDYCDTNM